MNKRLSFVSNLIIIVALYSIIITEAFGIVYFQIQFQSAPQFRISVEISNKKHMSNSDTLTYKSFDAEISL